MRFQSYTSTIGTYSYSYSWALTTITATTFSVAVMWFMTEILGITSYKQEDHLLGLVWVTILGLVFELFW